MNSLFRTKKIFCILSLLSLVGCSTIDSLTEDERFDYKSQTKNKKNVSRLEVPPDLTKIPQNDRFSLPKNRDGSVTASDYNQHRPQQVASANEDNKVIAPKTVGDDIRMERDGNQRWLVVKRTPEQLWEEVRDFWQDSGFFIETEQPDAGVMETDWAENRAKIPQDLLRRTLGKIIDSVYSTGEMDKFRTRLERTKEGTEIYISHRGAQEVLVGQEKERSQWEARPSDPELEAEFLSRLMVRLGAKKEKAKEEIAQKVKSPDTKPEMAHLIKNADESYLEVDEDFDRVWRRVGLALDRVGFTVEDRDRSQGLYYVRYVDQKIIEDNKGWFSKLFSSKKKDQTAKQYRISVSQTAKNSKVMVFDKDGKIEKSETGYNILNLLRDQLK